MAPQIVFFLLNMAGAPQWSSEEMLLNAFNSASSSWEAACNIKFEIIGKTNIKPIKSWSDELQPDFLPKIGWDDNMDTTNNITAITTDVFDQSASLAQADILISTKDPISQDQLASLLTHEMGHVIGLAHQKHMDGSIMEYPYIDWRLMSKPTEKDIRRCRAYIQAGRFTNFMRQRLDAIKNIKNISK